MENGSQTPSFEVWILESIYPSPPLCDCNDLSYHEVFIPITDWNGPFTCAEVVLNDPDWKDLEWVEDEDGFTARHFEYTYNLFPWTVFAPGEWK